MMIREDTGGVCVFVMTRDEQRQRKKGAGLSDNLCTSVRTDGRTTWTDVRIVPAVKPVHVMRALWRGGSRCGL